MGDGTIALRDSLTLLPWDLRVTSTSSILFIVCQDTLARGKVKSLEEML